MEGAHCYRGQPHGGILKTKVLCGMTSFHMNIPDAPLAILRSGPLVNGCNNNIEKRSSRPE